jgi:hypothetical protein
MRQAGHIEHMESIRNSYKYFPGENLKGREHEGHLSIENISTLIFISRDKMSKFGLDYPCPGQWLTGSC